MTDLCVSLTGGPSLLRTAEVRSNISLILSYSVGIVDPEHGKEISARRKAVIDNTITCLAESYRIHECADSVYKGAAVTLE